MFRFLTAVALVFGVASCQVATETPQGTASRPKPQAQVDDRIVPLKYSQMMKLFSGKTFAMPGETDGGRWRQSITYLRDDTNRAYRYYPHWTKTGLDYYAMGKLTKEKVKGPRTFEGKTFNNLEAFCITDELSRNSSACSTVFRKGNRYFMGTHSDAEIVFSDGYHNLLTPLVKRGVADNNNKLLWALAGDFKRLEPDLVSKFRKADMRVWANNQNQIRAENAKIEAANKRVAQQRAAKAEASRKAREAKCMKETGKACSSGGGGLMGALLVGTVNAINNAGNAPSGGGSASSYQASYTYTVVCRERLLMEIDSFRDGPSMSCTGEVYQCEQKLEDKVKAQYGSLYKACRLNGPDWSYERTKHN